METVIEFLGFSLGAGLAIRAIDAVGGGLRPLVKGAMKASLAATDATGLTGRGRTVDTAERRADREDTEPRQIVIARE